MAEILLEIGGVVNAREFEGETPLMIAAGEGRPEMVSFLIGEGADINAISYNGETALARAVLNGQISTVKVLLHRGARPNISDGVAVHYAAAFYGGEMLRLLLSRGADVNVRDACGATPLISALQQGRGFETIRTLVDAGADVNVQNCDGESALRVANEKTTIEIVEMLKQEGARD